MTFYPNDLLNGLHSAPGRVRTFLQKAYKGCTPHSCSLIVVKNPSLADCKDSLKLTSKYLRGGAGVKLILDEFQAHLPVDFNWYFYLNPAHPDYNKTSSYFKQFEWAGQKSQVNWIRVNDSMEESTCIYQPSIESSWSRFIDLAIEGKTIVVDLSLLRPNGTENNRGLVSTGPVGDGEWEDVMHTGSFLSIYERIAAYLKDPTVKSYLQLVGAANATIRRGGEYKDGINTTSMRYTHPLFSDYLDIQIGELPGSHKQGARVDKNLFDDPAYEHLIERIIDKRNNESMFLSKIRLDGLLENVCVGILLEDLGTCLIWRVNLGMCRTAEDLIKAYREATYYLSHLHATWRNEIGHDRANIFRPLELDRQIAVDPMGAANLYRIWGVTYQEMVTAFEYFLGEREGVYTGNEKAYELVTALARAYEESCIVADEVMASYNLPLLDRIHTVEPSQNHSYQTKDAEGFTTARAIFPPFGRIVRRVSEVQKQKVVRHGNVEIAGEVGHDLNFRHAELWQLLMTRFGRPHAISLDTWKRLDRAEFEYFVKQSPLQTLYYAEHNNYNQKYLHKAAEAVQLEEAPVACGLRPGECATCAD